MNLPQNTTFPWDKRTGKSIVGEEYTVYVLMVEEFRFELCFDKNLWNGTGGWRINVAHIFLGELNPSSYPIIQSYQLYNEEKFNKLEWRISRFVKDYLSTREAAIKTTGENLIKQALLELEDE